MILEPTAIVLYVDNLVISSKFYQELFGIKPEASSPTFHTFTLSNGMGLGLKVKHTVEPPTDHKNGSSELAFTLDNKQKVDALFAEWQEKDINMALHPTVVPYGYTFVALDPDDNRLRVVSLGKSFTPPTLKYLEGFTVRGLSTKTQNTDEFNEKTAKLPSLWQQFYTSDLAVNANIFEVYSDYESDANGLYTVTIGRTDNSELTDAEFASVKIPTGNYLVFKGEGPMPATVVEIWKQIWDYFDAKSNYQRSFISDFEAYSGADKVDIYIGIK